MTILILTIRQFLRSKSLYVVFGICLLAALFAVIPLFNQDEFARTGRLREFFGEVLFLELFSGTLLSLATLVISTGAIGDELEDRTLQYLALKPISRARIVLSKYLAVLIVLIPLLSAGLALSWTICSWGRFDETSDMLWPAIVAATVGIAGFSAVFMLLSMVIQRALLVGVFYVFVWEATLSRFLPGIRMISIRHYMQSIFVRMLDDRRIRIDDPSADTTIVITTIAIVVVSLALATWRLRAMSLE
jgi:ABC-2 type transport system permease protein